MHCCYQINIYLFGFAFYVAALWRMASPSKEMKVQCVNPDGISGLPQDITGYILACMPIRDAIRTSILSRKWRSGWKSMTKLVFDDKMVKDPSNCQQLKKYKFASTILNVLLIITGSIPEIKIEVSELDVDSELDHIICYLSRNNHLKKICFLGSLKHCYKLPSSFFSLQGLEEIGLYNCLFRPPIIFDGFSKLRSLCFGNVDITSKTFLPFLSNCPLLRDLALMGDYSRDFATGGNKFTFVELLQCVPLIEILVIEGGMPHKLPTSLVHLKYLLLEVCYDKEYIVSSALCLIRSSPNLEKISLTAYDKSDTAHISKTFPGIQDYSGFTLDHLEIFQMVYFANEDLKVDFLKLIMAISPVLKKAQIVLYKSVSLEKENEMLRNLLELPFPRASPSAKLIIKRPNPAS
ncbi:F-box/FBD/LRR-repeat protein [Tanacetum coccineum]